VTVSSYLAVVIYGKYTFRHVKVVVHDSPDSRVKLAAAASANSRLKNVISAISPMYILSTVRRAMSSTSMFKFCFAFATATAAVGSVAAALFLPERVVEEPAGSSHYQNH